MPAAIFNKFLGRQVAHTLILPYICPSQKSKAVPHSSRLYRDEWAAKSRRPLRLDFNHSTNSGSVVVETAPLILFSRCDKSPLDRIAMDISDHFGPGCLPMNVRVIIAGLPELLAIASQLAGSDLLERLQKLRHEDGGRLVDQQVNMFRHQHISVNPGLMTCPSLFQNGFDRYLGARRFKERKPVKATERDEVKSLSSLEPLQAIGHIVIVMLLRPYPKTHSSR